MSLEFILDQFPTQASLRDGSNVTLRPLHRRDEAKLHRFFAAVPEVERLFIKCRVTDRACLRERLHALDLQADFGLLMLKGAQVVGEGMLHQRPGGWKRHIGLVSVLTHPDYRGRDVAKIIVRTLIDVARQFGLRKLEAKFNGERKVAIRAVEELGFRELYRIPDYLLDMNGVSHDYVVLGMDLITDEEYASTG
jgi:GNAT superfamily N-acetyltransferase